MHRTRITANLLVGVAVTAVSGCVAVEPQAVAPPRPETSRPVQDVAPQIVQPPVRESLESLPDPTPDPTPSATAAPPEAAPSGTDRAGSRAPRQRDPVPAPAPSLRAPRQSPRVPPVAVPTAPDVCALGRGYGGWAAGSAEARICEETYGH